MSNRTRRRAFIREFILLIIGVVSLVLLGAFFLKGGAKGHGVLTLRFQEDGKEPTPEFLMETASTPRERERGLMYRKELPERSGMIFLFSKDAVHSFWMRETYVSLDMLFVTSDFRIAGILENVPILNQEPRTIGEPTRHVIELPAGTAKKYELKKGMKVIVDPSTFPPIF